MPPLPPASPIGRRSLLRALVAAAFPAITRGGEGRPVTRGASVAVIVHPSRPVASLSRASLVRIFTLRQQRWPDGRRIYLVLPEEGSFAKKIILKKIYRMTSDELKRFWLAKIYRGEMTSFPKTLRSEESMRRFVGRVPNAIGVMDAAWSDASVKVLTIDGLQPGDDGYLLSSDDGVGGRR